MRRTEARGGESEVDMICQVGFRNFKGLRHVDFNLDRLTVIVGPNASGKTSILEGLSLLAQLHNPETAELLGGRFDFSFLLSRGGQDDLQLRLFRETEGARFQALPSPSLTSNGSADAQ